MIKNGTASPSLTCEHIKVLDWNPDLVNAPDDDLDGHPNLKVRSLVDLEERTQANPRPFTVDCGNGPVIGMRPALRIRSMAYPNRGNGATLQQASGLAVHFALANPADFVDASIDVNAPVTI